MQTLGEQLLIKIASAKISGSCRDFSRMPGNRSRKSKLKRVVNRNVPSATLASVLVPELERLCRGRPEFALDQVRIFVEQEVLEKG